MGPAAVHDVAATRVPPPEHGNDQRAQCNVREVLNRARYPPVFFWGTNFYIHTYILPSMREVIPAPSPSPPVPTTAEKHRVYPPQPAAVYKLESYGTLYTAPSYNTYHPPSPAPSPSLSKFCFSAERERDRNALIVLLLCAMFVVCTVMFPMWVCGVWRDGRRWDFGVR